MKTQYSPTAIITKWIEEYRKEHNLEPNYFVSPGDLLTWFAHKEAEKLNTNGDKNIIETI